MKFKGQGSLAYILFSYRKTSIQKSFVQHTNNTVSLLLTSIINFVVLSHSGSGT